MAKPFVLGVNLRIQQVLGLDKVKQQLVNVQIGGAGQVSELSKGLKDVSVNASKAAVNTAKASSATANLEKRAKRTGNELGVAAGRAKDFGDQIFLAGKRYAAFLAATVGAYKALQLISVGTQSVVEFDQAMVSLSQILEKPVNQIQNLSQQFLDLSVATGTSVTEIANAAKLLAQAGFRGNELTETVEQLAKVPLTPIFEGMEQAVDGVIAVMRQFSDEGLTVEQIFDKLTKVSLKYAASMPEIIEGIKRGGSAFVAMGGTLDEFIAAFTTIRSVTRESASAVGTSIKTITARLADPAFAGFLEARGVRLFEEGQFVGPIEAMRRIGNEMERLGELSKEALEISTKIGGKRQISRFLALSRNMEKNNEILETSRNSVGAFSDTAEKGLQAIGKQIDILINKAKKLAIDLGEDLFIPFIKGLTGAAEAAIILLDVLKPILPIVATIATTLAGGAFLRGVGGLLGPRLGKLAGPAASAAAGGGFKGMAAGLGASPFAQAGLLIAASEAAAALTKTAKGADSFTSSLISYTGSIIAMISLIKGQTITGFLGKGGLFPRFGKVAGGLLTAGAITISTAGILELQRSQRDLSNKILKNTIQSINGIKIDPVDPQSLQKGFSEFAVKIREGLQQSVERTDPFAEGIGIGERIARSFSAGLRVIDEVFSSIIPGGEGDWRALFRRGAVTSNEIKKRFNEIIEKSPQFIGQIIDNISQAMATTAKEKIPSGRYALTMLAMERGATEEEAKLFTKAIIDASGGLEEFNETIDKNVKKISDEISARDKLVQLTKITIPSRLIGQLSQFSKAVARTTDTINLSAKLFETQIAEIAGGVKAPVFDFDFGIKQIENLIRSGDLKGLFEFVPDIPKFVGTFNEIEKLLDNFIINIGNLPVGDIDIAGEVDRFFESQENVPQAIRDNFKDFFTIIAEDIRNVSGGKFIDIESIKQRFKKEFEDLGVGTSDVIVEAVANFINTTFDQIEDELNRLATIRKFELAVPVRPETQAAFLEKQLRRTGVFVGGGRQVGNLVRGTLEELDLIRREMEERGRGSNIPGFLPTPTAGFFQGRDQRLAEIAGDERIRQQVRNSFQKIITESSILRKSLAELKPGTEGFISASQRAKELARSTIELQTTLEALDQVTQQALESERRTLQLRQELELAQTRARLAEKVRVGALRPIEAERILFDLTKEQEKAQIELQDRYDAIIEKDNALRVNLAKEISQTTKTQAEIIGDFNISANIFADATRIQATTVDLMRQYIIDFGKAVIDFTDLIGPPTGDGTTPKIIPAQIKTGLVDLPQAWNEYNRLMNENNTLTQEVRDQIVELYRAIMERQEQVGGAATPSKELLQSLGIPTAETNQKMGELVGSLDGLSELLRTPNEIKLVTDQRIDLELSTLPNDISEAVRPILEEAVTLAAKTVTRKALESLAAKSDSEVSIAVTDVVQELI